jgi:hypothetical protein
MVGPAWTRDPQYLERTMLTHGLVQYSPVTDQWAHPSVHPLPNRSPLTFLNFNTNFGICQSDYSFGASVALYSPISMSYVCPSHVPSSSLRVAAGKSPSRPTGHHKSAPSTYPVAWDHPLCFLTRSPCIGTDPLWKLQMLCQMQLMCVSILVNIRYSAT